MRCGPPTGADRGPRAALLVAWRLEGDVPFRGEVPFCPAGCWSQRPRGAHATGVGKRSCLPPGADGMSGFAEHKGRAFGLPAGPEGAFRGWPVGGAVLPANWNSVGRSSARSGVVPMGRQNAERPTSDREAGRCAHHRRSGVVRFRRWSFPVFRCPTMARKPPPRRLCPARRWGHSASGASARSPCWTSTIFGVAMPWIVTLTRRK